MLLKTVFHITKICFCGKKPSDSCPLCGHTQSLVHVLNNCSVALQLRRYNKRHDAVLKSLSDFISSNLPPDFQLTADLPKSKYNPPPCIKLGDLRPDIIYWSESEKAVVIVELTICMLRHAILLSARAEKSQIQRNSTLSPNAWLQNKSRHHRNTIKRIHIYKHDKIFNLSDTGTKTTNKRPPQGTYKNSHHRIL